MKIKSRPEDFRVQEHNTLASPGYLKSAGRWGVYELSKSGLTTPDAIDLAAGRLGLRPDQFRYAGLKDRWASTSQVVTVDTDRDCSAAWPGLALRLLGRAARPVRPSDILANSFAVVSRDLDAPASQRLLAAAAAGGTFVNYFDDQRFGSVRQDGVFAGEALVRRRWRSALRLILAAPGPRDGPAEAARRRAVASAWGDWTVCAAAVPAGPWRRAFELLQDKPTDVRRALNALPRQELVFHLVAWQSQVWNECARAAVRAADPAPAVVPGLAGPYLLPAPGKAPSLDVLPVLGRRLTWPGEAAEALVRQVLAGLGLAPQDFVVRGLARYQLHAGWRPLMVRPADLRASPPEADELNPGRSAIELGFSLPPGAYATMLLKSLARSGLPEPAEDAASI